jgi:hypothetical protein
MADMSELDLATNEEMEGEYPGEQQPGEKRDLTVSAVITPHSPPPPRSDQGARPLTLSSTRAPQEDGGVFKEILTPGSGWETPEKGDKVSGAPPARRRF